MYIATNLTAATSFNTIPHWSEVLACGLWMGVKLGVRYYGRKVGRG
jgi:hypothetical protein